MKENKTYKREIIKVMMDKEEFEEFDRNYKKVKRDDRLYKQKHKVDYCAGCRNNFYNGRNDVGVKECWSLKSAKVVMKDIYQSLDSTTPVKTKTLDCYLKQYH